MPAPTLSTAAVAGFTVAGFGVAGLMGAPGTVGNRTGRAIGDRPNAALPRTLPERPRHPALGHDDRPPAMARSFETTLDRLRHEAFMAHTTA